MRVCRVFRYVTSTQNGSFTLKAELHPFRTICTLDTLSNIHYNVEISHDHLNRTSGHKAPQDTMYGVHRTSSILLQSSLLVSRNLGRSQLKTQN